MRTEGGGLEEASEAAALGGVDIERAGGGCLAGTGAAEVGGGGGLAERGAAEGGGLVETNEAPIFGAGGGGLAAAAAAAGAGFAAATESGAAGAASCCGGNAAEGTGASVKGCATGAGLNDATIGCFVLVLGAGACNDGGGATRVRGSVAGAGAGGFDRESNSLGSGWRRRERGVC